jgi:hypothetical protein
MSIVCICYLSAISVLGVWTYLQIDWTRGNGTIQSIVATARQSFRKPFSMEVILTACWHIWLIRNRKILGRRDLALQDGGATSCMPLLCLGIELNQAPRCLSGLDCFMRFVFILYIGSFPLVFLITYDFILIICFLWGFCLTVHRPIKTLWCTAL